jgi:hypothetical protein
LCSTRRWRRTCAGPAAVTALTFKAPIDDPTVTTLALSTKPVQ